VSATGVDAVVSSEHLSKWYGQVIGLNDVTVAVPSGITGLLGPNGAGKSTFMKLITGQLKPSKGGVTVLGEPIWGNPSAYFRIGFCPEQDRFYERMTGREWVTALVGLNGITDATTATAYSVAQQLVTTAWNILLAIVLVVWAFGWSGGKQLVGDSYAEAKQKAAEQQAARKEKKEAKRRAKTA